MNEALLLPRTRRFDRFLLESGGRARGRVEAVFEHAAVVLCDEGRPALTLLGAGRELVPCGIEVPFGALRPLSGERVSLEGRRLAIGEGRAVRLEGEGVSLLLRGKPASRSGVGRDLRALELPARARAILAFPPVAVPSTAEARAVAAAGAALGRLVEALGGGGPGGEAEFVSLSRRLCGLGPGTTPTGDDLLTGVAAAGHRFRGAGLLDEARFRAYLGALEALPREATTPVAREMIAHAVRGAFSAPLVRFACALGREGTAPDEVPAAAARLAALGAQTGEDLLAGVVAVGREIAGTGTGTGSG